jgi:hypothetical protein
MRQLVSIVARPRTLAVLGVAAVAVPALSGCGGTAGTLPGGFPVVRVSERDIRIKAPRRLPAGNVVLQVQNRGPDAHELIVFRSPDGRLPLRPDGLTVDEEGLQRSELGALEPGEPGSVRELKLHLRAGRYVLLCNMEGHYLGGMRAVLVVR